MNDRKFFWLVTSGALLLAIIPITVGLLLRPPGVEYFGNSIINASDPAVYYSYIEQGRQGHLFMIDAFTSEPQRATLLEPVWFVVGQAANVLHVSTITIFYLARWASLGLLLWTVWWALHWFSPDRLVRRFGLLLAAFAGGLGGFTAIIKNLPIPSPGPVDLWVAEMFTYLSSLTSAHFLLVTAGMIFVFVSLERSVEEASWGRIPWAGLVALLVFSIHPFHLVTWLVFWLLLLVWHWWQRRHWPSDYFWRMASILFISLPVLFMYAAQLVSDPVFAARAQQNILITPNPGTIFLSLGLVLPLAVYGAWRSMRKSNQAAWATLWAMAIFIAIYLPVSFQRRLSHGLIIPLSFLAAEPLARWWARRVGWRWFTTFLTIVMSTSALVAVGLMIHWDVHELTVGEEIMTYLRPETQQLVAAVKKLPPQQGAILSSVTNGMVLAGLTAHPVFNGHGVETLEHHRKVELLRWFFHDASISDQHNFLRQWHICYILWGPREQAYGQVFKPAIWTDLTTVWQGQTMTLYFRTSCN